MSLRKFEDMVAHQHLFFTKLRHIVDREIDVFEGALADVNFDEPEVNIEWFLREVLAPGQPPEIVETIRRQFGSVSELRRQQELGRDLTYINCWFIGEFESECMWKDYVPDGRGVVVQSTIRKLRHSFDGSPGFICIQPVTYYDRTSRHMVPVDLFHTPLYKNISYRREQELRCFVVGPEANGFELYAQGIGTRVPCDVAALVERVRTPPGAENAFFSEVDTIIRSSAVPNIRLERSALR